MNSLSRSLRIQPARLLQMQTRANSSQVPEKEVSPHVREELLLIESDMLIMDTDWLLQDFLEANRQGPAYGYVYISGCILGVGLSGERRDQGAEDWWAVMEHGQKRHRVLTRRCSRAWRPGEGAERLDWCKSEVRDKPALNRDLRYELKSGFKGTTILRHA